jgi:hypothetical protein
MRPAFSLARPRQQAVQEALSETFIKAIIKSWQTSKALQTLRNFRFQKETDRDACALHREQLEVKLIESELMITHSYLDASKANGNDNDDLDEQVALAVTSLTRVWSSSVRASAGTVLIVFFRPFRQYCNITLIRLIPLPSKSFPIHH